MRDDAENPNRRSQKTSSFRDFPPQEETERGLQP
jgi:hypothetical protein